MAFKSSMESSSLTDGNRHDPVQAGIVAVVLVALVFMAYNGVLNQKLVNWDDGAYLATNKNLNGGLTWKNVNWAFSGVHLANYHPITWLSFLADIHIYGMHPFPMNGKPWGFKLTNLVIHAANSVLVFWLFLRMTNRAWASFLVGALFALHPLHVESVAWATERKDVLSTFFVLLSMESYLRFARRASAGTYVLMLTWYVLSLLSKQMYVTLPAVLLLLDYWPLRRVGWTTSEERNPSFPAISWRRGVAEKVPLLALAVAASVLIYAIQVLDPLVRNVVSSPSVQLQNVIYSYGVYLRKTVWPTDLTFFYPFPREPYPATTIVFWAGLLLGLSAAAFVFRRRAPYLFCGWLWYLGTLVPVIGLVQIGWHAYADRYTYFPLIGLFFAAVYGLDDLVHRHPAWDAAVKVVEVGAVSLCLALTMGLGIGPIRIPGQVGVWKDSGILSQQALSLDPNNFVALVQLGMLVAADYQWEKAAEYLRAGRDLQPRYWTTHVNLATVELVLGNTEAARKEYEVVCEVATRNEEAFHQLGMIQLGNGEVDEAIGSFDQAMRINPRFLRAAFGMGLARVRRKDYSEARANFERVRTSPWTPNEPMRQDAGKILVLIDGMEKGDHEAIQNYRKWYDMPATVNGSMTAYTAGLSLGLRAERSRAAGDAKKAEKEISRAIEEFERAIRLWPNNYDAIHNLGVLHFQLGHNTDAMSYFKRALEIKPLHEPSLKGMDLVTERIVGRSVAGEGANLRLSEVPKQDSQSSSSILQFDPTADVDLFK